MSLIALKRYNSDCFGPVDYMEFLNVAEGGTVYASSPCRINLGRAKQLSGQGPDPARSYLKKRTLSLVLSLVALYHHKLFRSTKT